MVDEYKLAICDDDYIQLNNLKSLINNYFTYNNLTYSLVSTISSEELIAQIKNNKIHIYLLDIEIDKNSGIDIANEIRKSDINAIIIFITGFADYGYDAFKVKAFDYLLKPIRKATFYELMTKAISELDDRQYLQKNKYGYIMVNLNKNYKQVFYDDILYFYKSNRDVHIKCIDDEIVISRSSLKKVSKQLDLSLFYKCHEGYIINAEKIHGYQKGFVYLGDNRIPIPVSKNYVKTILALIKEKVLKK